MNDVTEFACELLACPSITPLDAGCQALLAERLTRLGFCCESLRFGEVDNLYARYGSKGPLLVFAGHTDVVPTGPESDWQSPPFQPEIRDEYLYARGAVDMKGAIAAMVTAVETFLKTKKDFDGSIGFLITSDEEGPAVNGTQKVMETLLKRGEKIDYCIVGEPSSDKQVGDQIRVGRRGSLHGKLIVHGKQGHVAHPHLAINPIHQTALAFTALAQTEWDQGDDYFPPTTFQITNLQSGTGAANVIPGHLSALFNFRFSPASTVDGLKQRTEKTLRDLTHQFDVEWSVGAEPFLSGKGKLTTAVQTAIRSVTGLETRLSTGGGTSDGRFIAPTGAEVVEIGLSHATAHHVNECVKVDDLEKLKAIYLNVLTNW